METNDKDVLRAKFAAARTKLNWDAASVAILNAMVKADLAGDGFPRGFDIQADERVALWGNWFDEVLSR